MAQRIRQKPGITDLMDNVWDTLIGKGDSLLWDDKLCLKGKERCSVRWDNRLKGKSQESNQRKQWKRKSSGTTQQTGGSDLRMNMKECHIRIGFLKKVLSTKYSSYDLEKKEKSSIWVTSWWQLEPTAMMQKYDHESNGNMLNKNINKDCIRYLYLNGLPT